MSIRIGWRVAWRIAGMWALASCTQRNPDACCETDAECLAVGFDSHEPCALGACVQNQCTITPGACDGDEDCGEASACVEGTCAGCRSSATCPAEAPACDPISHACRGCVEDRECGSLACDLAAGSCVDQSAVLYVTGR